jgi:hypothetical protein
MALFSCKLCGFPFEAVRKGKGIAYTVGGGDLIQGQPPSDDILKKCRYTGSAYVLCTEMVDTVMDAIQAGKF